MKYAKKNILSILRDTMQGYLANLGFSSALKVEHEYVWIEHLFLPLLEFQDIKVSNNKPECLKPFQVRYIKKELISSLAKKNKPTYN